MPLLIPIGFPIAGTGGDSSLLNGLLAYWKLEEAASATRQDSVGSQHLSNSGAVAQVAGKSGFGADFSAAGSDVLQRADSATLSPTGSATLAGWVKLDDLAATYVLASKWLAGGDQSYRLEYDTTEIRFHISSDGTSSDSVGSGAQPTAGAWVFVAAWLDTSGSGTLNVQVNNGTVQSTSPVGGIHDGGAAFSLGGNHAETSDYLNGSLDEWGLWSRVLTAAERALLYNNGSGTTYPFPGTGPGAGIQYVTTFTNTWTGASGSITVPAGGVAAGQRGVLCIASAASGGFSSSSNITDSRGNTWALSVAQAPTAAEVGLYVYTAQITTALQAGDTISIANGVASKNYCGRVLVFSGLNTSNSSVLDTTGAFVSGTSSTPASSSSSTGNANDVLVGVIGALRNDSTGPGFLAGSGYTAVETAVVNGVAATLNDVALHVEYRIVSSAGSYAAAGTLGGSYPWGALMVAYKQA